MLNSSFQNFGRASVVRSVWMLQGLMALDPKRFKHYLEAHTLPLF